MILPTRQISSNKRHWSTNQAPWNGSNRLKRSNGIVLLRIWLSCRAFKTHSQTQSKTRHPTDGLLSAISCLRRWSNSRYSKTISEYLQVIEKINHYLSPFIHSMLPSESWGRLVDITEGFPRYFSGFIVNFSNHCRSRVSTRVWPTLPARCGRLYY